MESTQIKANMQIVDINIRIYSNRVGHWQGIVYICVESTLFHIEARIYNNTESLTIQNAGVGMNHCQ